MFKVGVIGSYDCTYPMQLFDIDLMQMLAQCGVAPCAVIFKPSNKLPFADNKIKKLNSCHSVIQTTDFNAPACVAAIKKLDLDLLVYAGGRDILRAPLLDAAKQGCLGGHYGELPTIRGMGTVEWSILYDVPCTVTIQRINPGIDTGEIIMASAVPFCPNDEFIDIRSRSYTLTKIMLALSAHKLLMDPSFVPTPQDTSKGQQFFRMHPTLAAVAKHKLKSLLKRYQ